MPPRRAGASGDRIEVRAVCRKITQHGAVPSSLSAPGSPSHCWARARPQLDWEAAIGTSSPRRDQSCVATRLEGVASARRQRGLSQS
jgi:hypothetical protein